MNEKAHAQMFLGQDGWFVKFKALRSNNFQVATPTLSSLLLNLPWLGNSSLPEMMLTGQSNARRPP